MITDTFTVKVGKRRFVIELYNRGTNVGAPYFTGIYNADGYNADDVWRQPIRFCRNYTTREGAVQGTRDIVKSLA